MTIHIWVKYMHVWVKIHIWAQMHIWVQMHVWVKIHILLENKCLSEKTYMSKNTYFRREILHILVKKCYIFCIGVLVLALHRNFGPSSHYNTFLYLICILQDERSWIHPLLLRCIVQSEAKLLHYKQQFFTWPHPKSSGFLCRWQEEDHLSSVGLLKIRPSLQKRLQPHRHW